MTLTPPDSLRTVVLEKYETISSMTPQEIYDVVSDFLLRLGLKIVAVVVIYIVGKWFINRIKHLIENKSHINKVDPSVGGFLKSFVNVGLTILLWIIIIGVLGVPTSTFAALIAAAGLSIGMALSGTLQNFAGGIMILVFKPFKVGDEVNTSNASGIVKAIKVTYTEIQTFDNVIITIPNGPLLQANVTNNTANSTRRIKWIFQLEYGDDVEKARRLILGYLAADERILSTPAPSVVLSTLADNGIELTVFGWTTTPQYWSVFWSMNEKMYVELPKEGLHFPYPKLDVNLVSNA